MSKFKVGDKVRRINCNFDPAKVGQIAVVIAGNGGGEPRVRWTKGERVHEQTWMEENTELVLTPETIPPSTFRSISGERARTYTFPDGSTFRVENVTGLCVRPTNHRLETSDGRKLIVPGKFIAIEIEAEGWGA